MIYNKLIEDVLLPIGDFFNNSSFNKKLKYWRKLDTLSEEDLNVLQNNNLEKLLGFSVNNVPYYRDIKLSGKNPSEWLLQFPILTKQMLKSNQEMLLIKSKKGLIKYSSSGSSGIQSSIYMNKEEQSTIRAILTHWWEWAGYQIGSPLVQTGCSPNRGILKQIKDTVFRTTYVLAFSLSEEELIKVLEKVKRSKKKEYSLVGYASSLNVIALIAMQNNYKIQFKTIISLGDKLFDHYEKNLTKAFASKVYDTYGCNEGFLIASQKDLKYKYIMSPHVYLEILDDDHNPVPDGEMGNIVVTRLDGYSMPLIRYQIGDLGIKLPRDEYPTKRDYNYPLLKKIVGRETDIVKVKNGSTLIVHTFTGVFEFYPEIKQFKVIQENLDGITIEFIKSESFNSNTLNLIMVELQNHIKDDSFNIIFKEVKTIAPTKSGKPQIIESKL